MNINPNTALAETRAWVDSVVIGLNLCPFAKADQVNNQIRYVCSNATSADALLAALREELHFLTNASPQRVETTLLVHPRVLTDFLDFNDFLEIADAALKNLDLAGIFQIVSFHPQYQFTGTNVADVSNATNRSPYPTLYLLREASIDRAIVDFPGIELCNRLPYK